MASVKKHLPILKLVQSSKPKVRQQIILHCGLDLINTIDECIYNTLKGNIPLKRSEIIKLKKFKKILRKICQCDGGLKQTRKKIVQSGGEFLPTLLQPIVKAGEAHFLLRKPWWSCCKKQKPHMKNETNLLLDKWKFVDNTYYIDKSKIKLQQKGQKHIDRSFWILQLTKQVFAVKHNKHVFHLYILSAPFRNIV